MSGPVTSGIDGSIKAIDGSSVHRITSGQVVIDLQTAVKELVENSLDAGATSVEIRFKNHGLKSIEVVDNGSGISENDYENIGRKHHTSKLSAFHDLTTLISFGFRGEALSSLCALCETVTVTTATVDKAPMGAVLELDKRGEVKSHSKAVRQRGTTVLLTSLFAPLPVRRKELERNVKREFGKALTLLNAYALGPCCGLGPDATSKAVRLSVTNQPDKGAKTTLISLPLLTSAGSSLSLRTVRAGTTALWGPKALDGVVDLEFEFEIPKITAAKNKGKARKLENEEDVEMEEESFKTLVKGLISCPAPTAGLGSTPRPGTIGRTSQDRQFFYVNGRPCTLTKVQKAINEIYRTFLPSNSTSGQYPFLVVDFTIPGDAVDVNITPDKRTIMVHAEAELCERMKNALEKLFSPSRSTYGVNDLQLISKSVSVTNKPISKDTLTSTRSASAGPSLGTKTREESDDDEEDEVGEQGLTSQILSPVRTGGVAQKVNRKRPGIDENEVPLAVNVPPNPSHRHIISSSELPRSQNKPLPSNDSQVVVINTSGASWNRPRNSFGRPIDLDTLAEPSSASRDDTNSEEPPRKKQKSSLPPSDADGDEDVDMLEDDEPERLERAPKGDKRRQKTEVNSGWVTLPDSSESITKPAPRQRKLTDMIKEKTSRQEMRSRLVGFARSGSQVVHEDEMEEEDKNEVVVVPEDERNDESVPLFLPGEDEDNDSSMVVESSDDLFVYIPSSKKSRNTASSAVSTSTDITTPPASSSVLDGNTSISEKPSEMVDLTLDDDNDISSFLTSSNDDQSQIQSQDDPLYRPDSEVIRTESSQTSTGDVRLRFNLSGISERWTKLHKRLRDAKAKRTFDNERKNTTVSSLAEEAGVSTVDAHASEAALSRVISKEDFKQMEVLGQFNLGFIVVRRRKKVDADEEQGENAQPLSYQSDDLFIVDQHAADEKYNFETLQQTTSIKSQKLFKPRPLELTASDELVALENLEVLRLNGFELEVDVDLHHDDNEILVSDERDSGSSKVHQGRIKLVAQPVSKSTVFDMRDLEELIQLMHDRPTGQMVRCSKARAMFAMRACRKSVMVGMPLTKGQMSAVVTHMGTMDQPWNCPHGRPTMRHLFDMANIHSSTQNERACREVDWLRMK